MDYWENLLPNEAPQELFDFVRSKKLPEVIVYKVALVDDYDFSQDPLCPDFKQVKMCECHCTACGDDFYANYKRVDTCHGGTHVAFVNPWSNEIVTHKQNTLCPCCNAEVTAVHTSAFGNKPNFCIYSNQILTAKNVNGHLALLCWYTEYVTDKAGVTTITAQPYEAYVTDNKKLRKYVGYQRYFSILCLLNKWTLRKQNTDTLGSFSAKEIVPFDSTVLVNTEAENSKLDIYCRTPNCYPSVYLNLYLKYHNAENIITSGGAQLLSSLIQKDSAHSYYSTTFSATSVSRKINLKKAKPHEIFGLSKAEYKQVIKSKCDYDYLEKYKKIKGCDRRLKCEDIDEIIHKYQTLYHCLDFIEKKISIYDALKYARRSIGNRFVILSDYYRFADELEIELNTSELLFPRNLDQKHDEFQDMVQKVRDEKRQELFKTKFERIVEKYGSLNYSNGNLCIFVCPNYAELKREGNVLRHCVGGYADRHTSETNVVFFIRHARRPERPYYTTDINFKAADKPYRTQLHGYGNERHGDYKQHRHSIPQKVLDFYAEWEKNILQPWFAEQKKKEKKQNGKSNNNSKQQSAVA